MAAAPTPVTARAAISAVGVSMKIGASEAVPKIAKPMSSAPRRPYRSPSAPAGSSRHAITRV
jgi:hypothetical protein